MVEQHSFGYWLRLKRKALDLTREGLADRVGCTAATIRKLEAEERRPSPQVVERLAVIFKIPPSEKSTFMAFARGDWKSRPVEIQDTFPWYAPTKHPRANLPARTTSLIGRESEISAVRAYLLDVNIRLVTLIGPPGVGKTRLSIESARESLPDFPDGVFFVPLAALEEPSLIVSLIIQAVGYIEEKIQPATQRLVDGIGDKQMLLVLDNCEHLIENVATLASELLSACSRLKILATSREALRIPGEWQYSVRALNIPEADSPINLESVADFPALTLFVERARAVRSDFVLNSDNIQHVASICAQLDGLPLAIELIAARTRFMSPQALLAALNDQLILYADGRRAVPKRQKTLYEAIAWSYDLLSQEEQKVFARLSVFSGGFTTEAADTIFSRTVTNLSISDLITSLLDKSLLHHALGSETHDEPRLSMLNTISQFALEHLRRLEKETEACDWHLAYFLELAEQADSEIHGPDQTEWINLLEIEHDNFRAALEWCIANQETEAGLRLLGALGWPWMVRNRYSEMQGWFNQIRVLPEIISHPALYARLLNQVGFHRWLSGDYRGARSVLEESRVIWLKVGADGERGLAESFYHLGMVAMYGEGDERTSRSLFEKSLDLYRKYDDSWGLGTNTFRLAMIEMAQNHDALAISLLEESLSRFKQSGDLWGIARVSPHLGELFAKQADYERARLYIDQQLRLDERLGFKQGIALALLNLGNLYRDQGDYEQAEHYYEKSLSISHQYGLKTKGYNLYVLGMLALHRNNYPFAIQFFASYLDTARASREKITVCEFLTAAAAIAAGIRKSECAAKLYGAAQAIFETIDYRISPFDRAEFDRHLQRAQESLGNATFEKLAAEGRTMTMEQAIEDGLELSTIL